MRHDKKDGLSIDIPGTFTSSTGAGADPGTSFKVYLFPAGSEEATVNGADLDKVGAIDGVYSYTWDITNVAVGQYYGYIMAVDSAINYPSAIEYDITDSRTTETQIDTIDTSVQTIITDLDAHILANGLGMGSGSIAIPLAYKETNSGKPYAGVNVWLTTDASGSILYTGKNYVTDSGGRITFFGQANSTYYWWSALQDTPVATITTNNTAVV